MAIIAVANQKGGVGKTTSTLNLGAALQERGKRVLLIDLDPQGNLGVAAGISDIDNAYPSIGDLLSLAARGRSTHGGLTLDDGIVPTPSGLDVVPSNSTLSAAELALVSAMNRESALAGVLKRATEHYDHILIDCLPSLGLLAINALRAADTVVVPVQADFLAMQGLAQIFETIAAVREQLNPQLGILGVLLTLVDQRTAHSREVVEAVRSSLEGQVNVFETEVRQQVALKDTAKLGRSILETEPDGASAAAYRSLAHEVLVALGEEEATPPPMVEVEEEVVEPAVVSAPPKGIALFVPSFETFVQEGWPQWLGSAASSSTPRLDGQRYRPNRLAQARAAVVEHRFEDAARQASHVLSDAAGCLMSLRILAWAQLELGDERAVASFERCVELDPEDARAEVGQAIWHQQREHEAAAVAHWLRAWELDPHNQLIRRALVRLTGDLPDSLLAEGIGLLRVGRWDEAAEVLRQVLAANPSDTAANLGLIAAWRALGARRQADELAIAVHTLAPSCIKGLLYVAAMQEAEGRKLRSRDLLARAEQADPGLVLFADVAHELFALPVPAETRASRPTLASAG